MKIFLTLATIAVLAFPSLTSAAECNSGEFPVPLMMSALSSDPKAEVIVHSGSDIQGIREFLRDKSGKSDDAFMTFDTHIIAKKPGEPSGLIVLGNGGCIFAMTAVDIDFISELLSYLRGA